MSKKLLDTYYNPVLCEEDGVIVIFATEKKYFDDYGYLDDSSGNKYSQITAALFRCGYSELAESIYEFIDPINNLDDFNHKEFVERLAKEGLNMVRNADISHF